MLSARRVFAVIAAAVKCRRGVTAVEYALIAAVMASVLAATMAPFAAALTHLYAVVIAALG